MKVDKIEYKCDAEYCTRVDSAITQERKNKLAGEWIIVGDLTFCNEQCKKEYTAQFINDLRGMEENIKNFVGHKNYVCYSLQVFREGLQRELEEREGKSQEIVPEVVEVVVGEGELERSERLGVVAVEGTDDEVPF